MKFNLAIVVALCLATFAAVAQNPEANKKTARLAAENWTSSEKLFSYLDQKNFKAEMPGQPAKDFDAFKTEHQGAAAAFPDGKVEVLDVAAEGDRVYLNYHWSGTNKGELMPGVPPTGKKVDMTGVSVMTFQNGKITRMQDFYDSQAMMVQLGLAADPAAAMQQPANDQAAVLKMWGDVWKTYETDDAAMWSFYAPEAYEIYPDGSTANGLEAIRSGYEMFKTMMDGKPSWTFATPTVQFVTPDVALLHCEIVSDIKLKGVGQIGGKTRFAALVRRSAEGRWLIVFDQQTPVLPPPAGVSGN